MTRSMAGMALDDVDLLEAMEIDLDRYPPDVGQALRALADSGSPLAAPMIAFLVRQAELALMLAPVAEEFAKCLTGIFRIFDQEMQAAFGQHDMAPLAISGQALCESVGDPSECCHAAAAGGDEQQAQREDGTGDADALPECPGVGVGDVSESAHDSP